jgi:hypothetical protein
MEAAKTQIWAVDPQEKKILNNHQPVLECETSFQDI